MGLKTPCRHAVLLVLVFCLCFIAGNAQAPLDPCSAATPLFDAHKRTNSSSSSNDVCDIRITEAWYRVSTGKGSDLVTSCPALGAGCGTSFPVWLNGNIPHVGQGVVNGTACVTSLMSCCEQVLNVQVENCGTYRVWRLPPTQACPQSYCFENPDVTTTTTTTTTTARPKTPAVVPTAFPGRNPDGDRPDRPHDRDEMWEEHGEEKGLHIIIGIVSACFIISVVLNGYLIYRLGLSQGKQKSIYVRPVTPAPYPEKSRPPSAESTGPPHYKDVMNAERQNSWVGDGFSTY